MKTYHVILHALLAAFIAVGSSSPATSFADELFTVPVSPVYQAVKNSSLKDALAQVSQRSGIIFKIDTQIGQDIVHQSLSAADWNTAVKSLLHNYNYTLITEGKNIKTAIVTGRAGDEPDVTNAVASTESLEW
jgi:hypothetical protein